MLLGLRKEKKKKKQNQKKKKKKKKKEIKEDPKCAIKVIFLQMSV